MEDSIGFSHPKEDVNSFSMNVSKFDDNGYNDSWEKYGYKLVKGFMITRYYYKCTHRDCLAKKNALHSLDGNLIEESYKGNHNHQPLHANKLNSNGSSDIKECRQDLVQHMSGTSERQEVGGNEVVQKNDEPDHKRRNREVSPMDIPTSSRRKASEHRLVVETISDVDILDDGFKWRKYGVKDIKGNPNPRSYYKCTTPECIVQKHVERSPTDQRVIITTYEGMHNHDAPPPYSLILAKTSALQPKS